MNFMPARQWFPSKKTQDGKQLWYGKDRSIAERNFAKECYIEEIEKLKKAAT